MHGLPVQDLKESKAGSWRYDSIPVMFRFEERDSDIYNFRAGLDIVIFGCGTRQVDYKLYNIY